MIVFVKIFFGVNRIHTKSGKSTRPFYFHSAKTLSGLSPLAKS
jgi:hypothetical protein